MRILFLNPSGQHGGAERMLLDLIASIRRQAPEETLHLVAAGDGPLVEEARELGIEVAVEPFPQALGRLGDAGADGPAGAQIGKLRLLLRLAAAGPGLLAYLVRLRRRIRRAAPDVIHTNGFKMHLLGLWCRQGRPVVWHLHDYVRMRPLMARLLRLHARKVAAVATNSHSVAEDFRQTCLGSATERPGDPPVEAVHNAVDLDRFRPEGTRLDLDALAGLPPADGPILRVGLLATMGRWKGHLIFLDALSRLGDGGPPWRAYVVGGALYETDGSQHRPEELAARARQLGLADRVGFTGFVREPAAAMRALDIVVHASTQPEPFGLVIAEAMASGRPIVASRAGGVPELIQEGTDALAHAPGDADELATGIRRLLGDAALRRNLGQAGRSTAETRFDRKRLAGQFLPLYRQVVKG